MDIDVLIKNLLVAKEAGIKDVGVISADAWDLGVQLREGSPEGIIKFSDGASVLTRDVRPSMKREFEYHPFSNDK